LTHAAARSGSRGFRRPATFRSQGLVTLSTVCALAILVGLISCRQRLWGLTLRSFLLLDGCTTFLPCLPRMSLPRIRARRSRPTRANPEPDYQVLPPGNPLRHGGCLVHSRRWRLPWASSLSGRLSCRLDGCPHPSPLTRLSSDGLPSPVSCAAEYQSATTSPDPIGRAPLVGFFASSILALGRRDFRAILFTSRDATCYRVKRPAL
jgi:hypothetical protein